MHPEVLQDHPGNCPKCGMTLEPKAAKTGMGDEESADLRDMTQLLDRGRPCVAVFILAMVHLIPALGRQPWVNSDALRWMQFALATPVAWRAGWPLLHRGWRSVVGLLLSPIISGAAMSLSSVTGNALRLRKVNL
jgi:Cu+-exporting ATPase